MWSFYPPPNFSLFQYEEVFKLPTVYPLYSIILTSSKKFLKQLLKYVFDQKSPGKQLKILVCGSIFLHV